ncbi:MAG: efflux RND transporter periplasmic adaptor subunit [Alphaproteobacteria bacterium]|nr:efflux RND transporter periplasmic adaptor subunit [Alphaproteobacteria bacterium]
MREFLEKVIRAGRARLAVSDVSVRLAIAAVAIAAVGILIGYWISSGRHAALVSTASAAIEPQSNGTRRILYYRNAMNPSDTSPVPKKDSMGMDYVPVYSDEVSKAPGSFHLSTEKIQRAGVLTGAVKRMLMVDHVRASGTVAADESKEAILNARFDGFIDKLYVSTTGAVVRAGQPLARVWIQSPEVLVKEADLVGSLQTKATDQAQLAINILRQYGVPQSVIAEIERTGEPTRTIPIMAPFNGTVMEKPAVEGMHFAAGDMLFKTADLSKVWVMAQVSERDLAGLKPGQTAKITFRDNPGQSFEGEVAFIYPDVNPDTRTTQVRIVVANPKGDLRVGEYADVRIDAPISPEPVLAVPESAIMDDGTHQMAFLALPGGTFEARKVRVGARANGYDEILSGLNEGDRIVTSGNFLIDAESNLQTAVQTMSGASK